MGPPRPEKGRKMTREQKIDARTLARAIRENCDDIVCDCADFCDEYGDTFDSVAEYLTDESAHDSVAFVAAESIGYVCYDVIVRALGLAVADYLGY